LGWGVIASSAATRNRSNSAEVSAAPLAHWLTRAAILACFAASAALRPFSPGKNRRPIRHRPRAALLVCLLAPLHFLRPYR